MPFSTLCRAILLVFTCLASGCSGIHWTRHVQLASVQATSLRSFWKLPARNYTSILYRAELDPAHSSAPFILRLPESTNCRAGRDESRDRRGDRGGRGAMHLGDSQGGTRQRCHELEPPGAR